jgi:RNA polymerase sigma factor (TIGR02999 family)
MLDVPRARDGAPKRALDELFTRLYITIKDLAARVRWGSSRSSSPTLNPTALVHEAYLKLLHDPPDFSSKSSEEAIAIFANAMRQILIDTARRNSAQKRAPLSSPEVAASLSVEDALTLKALLDDLGREHPRQGRIVDCRFFLGMTLAETAAALNVSTATVEREWRDAKNRLGSRMSKAAGA